MKKRLLWLGELLVWGLILFSTIFLSLYIYNSNVRKKHTYYAFFKDVDGLIKGSPVKMLGYQVGYVSNISIVNEDVFVTFIITDKELEMPPKITATVSFAGLGASKSLELSVPEANSKAKNYVTTEEPKRIQDFYIYTNRIAQNIVGMTSEFMKIMDAQRTDMVKSFIKNPELLNQIHSTLDSVHKTETELMERRKNK